tara:strand:+ start:446 stop:652 length:207 start_codon:yes stop_codon:yes gene_type:complete
MAYNKKPTMMEVKNVLTNLIEQVEAITSHVQSIDLLVGKYFDYKEDTEDFRKWLEAQSKEDKDVKKEK